MMGRGIAASVAVCLALAGCGGGERTGSLLDKDTVTVGIRTDIPGIGTQQADGSLVGLDVDFSRHIVRHLGKRIRLVPVTSKVREPKLQSGEIDFAPTTWALPDRKLRMAFAGPYLRTSLDTLVRANDPPLRTVHDLRGRRLCAVKGAESAEQVTKERRVAAIPVDADTYDECVTMMRAGTVDAVSTNDVILAGIRRREGPWVKLANAPFGERPIAISMRLGDPGGCEAINKAITAMYQDGSAARILRQWFTGTGLDLSMIEVPQFEGCD